MVADMTAKMGANGQKAPLGTPMWRIACRARPHHDGRV